MYQPGTLRPPTAADMAVKQLPLEQLRIDHLRCKYRYCNVGTHVDSYGSPTISELISVCQENAIPYEAELVSNGYEGELALDWSHLAECPGCGLWVGYGQMAAHEDTDAHKAIVFARAHPPVVELTPEQMRILGRTPAA
jgi:hypothetical protein